MTIIKPRKVSSSKLNKRFFDRRYELLLLSILMIMFNHLFFKNENLIYQKYIWPLNMIFFGMAASRIIISDRKIYFYALIIVSISVPFWIIILPRNVAFERLTILLFVLLYIITLFNIIRGIFKSKTVSFNMVLGAFCGYLLLGLIAAFLNLALLSYSDQAIQGLLYFGARHERNVAVFSNILYYSFITITSIGYGDIHPTTVNAKMLSVFIGVVGQFYTTVIVALIIGKHLNRKK